MVAGVLVVHIVLALLNFLASIVQGIASFGDAVLLQVLWFIVCTAFPDPFNQTPLGDVPVKTVALLMYARVVFSAPYMAYLCIQSGGLFSKSMSLYMAIPSTICAVVGVYVFSKANGGSLMLFLGISSLIFAVVFTGILIYRYYKRRQACRLVGATSAAAVAITGTSASPNQHTSASSTAAVVTAPSPHTPQPATQVAVMNELDLVARELAAGCHASFAGPPAGCGLDGAGRESDSEDDDMRTVVSTATGEVFTRREARTPVINESEGGPNPAPLTVEQLSPTETMTYTRVQINRNLDENGKIKRTTKIAAGVAAAASGIMGSLTGVGAPPQVVFVLWFEVPQYIIRVNFAIQSIPSAVFRFGVAIYKPLFSWKMAPYLANAVISGYLGVFVGNKLGKLLGPNAFNIFVLMILLLSSLLMVTENPYVLALCTVVGFVVSGVVTWYERKTLLPKVEQQRAAETEVYANRPGIVSDPNASSRRTGKSATASPATAEATRRHEGSAVSPNLTAPPLPRTEYAAPAGAAGRNVHRSSSLATVDSELSNSVGRRQRKAEQFRPPSLFSTPTTAPPPPRAASTKPSKTTKATDVLVVSAGQPSASPLASSSVLQSEDKPRCVDEGDEALV